MVTVPETEQTEIGASEVYCFDLFPSIQTADWGTVISLPQLSMKHQNSVLVGNRFFVGQPDR
jgi:hypothetical protein